MTLEEQIYAIQHAVMIRKSQDPNHELVIVLPSNTFWEVCKTEKVVLIRAKEYPRMMFGCRVVECEYLESNTFVVSRLFHMEDLI